MTLREIYREFGKDTRYRRLAIDSLQSVDVVYLREIGNRDIKDISLQDIERIENECRQPVERIVKAKACMRYLLGWYMEQGKEQERHDRFKERQEIDNVHHYDNGQRGISLSVEHNKGGNDVVKGVDTKRDRRRIQEHAVIGDVEAKQIRQRGIIYCDSSSKGYNSIGKRVFKNCWRAEIQIDGIRYRHRSHERRDCEEWLKAVRLGKIKPTDNKADWWRMEQRKDEEVRIDELITSAAEETNIVYEYRHSGDTTILFDYAVKRLLPHMIYYCCHSLGMGKERTLKAAKQAIGLMLTNIVGGRPITNMTYTLKHMLRINKQRNNFWYFEKAPKNVQMLVNGIDFAPLAELYKVTKDRRL